MEESLVARRPKRSTAGNRMEAALAEFKAEDLGMDVEEDADFAIDKEEDDIFESDFESTDEEGAQEDVDAAAEKLIRQEESRTRKTTRTHLERVTARAHAQQAATFNPSTIGPTDQDKQKAEKKLKRRVSLGFAVNAETGEVLEGGEETPDANAPVTLGTRGRRHSTRTHTVANTSATVSRVRDEVLKQSSAPKRVKTKIKAPTQAELIAQALDMEEGNTEEHRNYLTLEEEKRKKARVVRTSVEGPLIRWISKKEEVTVRVQPPAPPLPPAPAPASARSAGKPYVHYRYPLPPSPSASSPSAPVTPYTYTAPQYPPTGYTPNAYTPTSPTYQYSSAQYNTPYPPPQYTSQYPAPSARSPIAPTQSLPFPQWPPPPPAYAQTTLTTPASPQVPAVITAPKPISASAPSPATVAPSPTISAFVAPNSLPPVPSEPIERKETVARQYVVHELDQTDKPSRPNWASTMTAMFGKHVNWENARVYTAKGRPFARPTQTCPTTGKVAKYLDPRTNVPYADLGAYRVLSAVLRHEYVWSPTLACYVSREGSVFAQGDT